MREQRILGSTAVLFACQPEEGLRPGNLSNFVARMLRSYGEHAMGHFG
eukprot:CAMPEP_0177464428 /NCGR_PEP_ID=MMETSP0369-20130122/16861_1 /TAXON_ID=447022 ORGANISM="Scrippsiella hangoei-like, Strain SHHI-4" /NCGR_SAMPLE_ID=MMETSP0369 /ASSEMBLY_ACC=CAM_ASM_000364 /LENGTH=47 /DNA_ID= /DNA_START= /DNA_END= /DNA_ORIENTATION=